MFAFNLGCFDTRHFALVEYKATDVTGLVLSPNNEDSSVRRVCDPSFAAVEDEMIALINCFRRHLAWVRTCVWLSETKAANELCSREPGDIFIFHRLVCVCVDREHDKGRLNGERRAITTIDILDRSVDQT